MQALSNIYFGKSAGSFVLTSGPPGDIVSAKGGESMETTPEKELLFENRTEIDSALLIKYARFRRWRSITPYVGIALFAYMIGMFLYYLIAWQVCEYLFLIMAAALIVMCVVIDVMNLRRDKRMLEEQAGGRAYVTLMRFYESEIRYGDASSEALRTADYAILRKLRETKELIVVSSAAKRDFLLKKDSFTVGREEDFKAFINRRIIENKK